MTTFNQPKQFLLNIGFSNDLVKKILEEVDQISLDKRNSEIPDSTIFTLVNLRNEIKKMRGQYVKNAIGMSDRKDWDGITVAEAKIEALDKVIILIKTTINELYGNITD